MSKVVMSLPKGMAEKVCIDTHTILFFFFFLWFFETGFLCVALADLELTL